MATTLALESIRRFLRTAPVDLERMARALRIGVVADAKLPPSIAARIDQPGPGPRITVNGALAPQRQRATLAIAIAHCLLHPDAVRGGLALDAHGLTGASWDGEADRCAAELLMPADLVRAFWNLGVRTTPEMARRFDVTQDSAAERLRALGLDRQRN